jgi:hypothetical protein
MIARRSPSEPEKLLSEYIDREITVHKDEKMDKENSNLKKRGYEEEGKKSMIDRLKDIVEVRKEGVLGFAGCWISL